MRAPFPALALLATAAHAGENDSFEQGLDGWTLEIGARLARDGPRGGVDVDAAVARDGEASLRFRCDATTRVFPMAGRTLPCEPGRRVLLQVAARCRGLAREGGQYANANGLLLFRDAAGNRLGLVATPVLAGDRDWVDLFAHALAPPGTAQVLAGVFSSQSGTAWFDDVRVAITPADPADRAARESGLAALRLHLERTYPFWDLEGRPEPAALPRDAGVDAATGLLAMLAPLRDVHVSIETPAGRLPTVRGNPAPPNWNDAALRARLTETLHDADGHLVGRIGDVGYAGVGNFERGFDALLAAVDRLADARALVIDVRRNGGGDERLGRRLARRFVAGPVVYGYAQVRDPTLPGLHGFRPRSPRRLLPAKDADAPPDRRPVAVLQGPYCVSSTEGFLLMMDQVEGVTRVGLRSRGASGGPGPFEVYDGIRVWTPRVRFLRADGRPVEGHGLEPDVAVEADHRDGDPTLARALELLAD